LRGYSKEPKWDFEEGTWKAKADEDETVNIGYLVDLDLYIEVESKLGHVNIR